MKRIIGTVIVLLSFMSCKKDDHIITDPPPVVNEGEVLTTVIMNFTDSSNSSNSFNYRFQDPDGEGGNPPVAYDTILLDPNTTYLVSLVILDETKNPTLDLTPEIQEEGEDHIFCYTPVNVQLEVERTDTDGTFEIGLISAWRTGQVSEGTVKVELLHQPGIKDGTCTPGDTDVSLEFVTKIL